MAPSSGAGSRWPKLLSTVGFASIAAAAVVAHRNPAPEYELSIYAGTPPAFWGGVVLSFLCAGTLAFTTDDDRFRQLGVVLGGLATVAVSSVSIMRGYFFHGVHDSLSHVGVARALTAGEMTPFETLYPGIHTVSGFLSELGGFSVWHSTLLVPLAIVLVFLVFVPFVVRAIAGGNLAGTVGAFSAFLLIPLHQLAATVRPHPSSQAILFVPVVLYLTFGYLRSPGSEGRRTVTAVGTALLVTVLALILYHPMQAINVIALFVAIGLLQFALKGTDGDLWQRHRGVAPVVAVSAVAYAAWLLQFPDVIAIVEGTGESVAGFFLGQTTPPGSAVGTQAASLQAIGSSLPIVFLKLFFVSTVYIVAAAAVVAGAIGGVFRLRNDSVDATRIIVYLTGGLAAMGVLFVVYFVGNVGQYYFRQASFMMMVLTVIGAFGIAYGATVVSRGRIRRAVGPGLVVAFTIMFVLSGLVLYNSPYIHRANQQITEARVTGYDTTFGVTGESAVVSGVMQEPNRYYQALVDVDGDPRLDGSINSSQITRLQAQPPDDWYLTVTSNTYQQELVAYREYRFSRSDFDSLHRQTGVDYVHSNGDLELYYVS